MSLTLAAHHHRLKASCGHEETREARTVRRNLKEGPRCCKELVKMTTGAYMTRAEIPSIQILGRPFKPLAVGLIMATGTMGLNALLQLLGQGTVVATPASLPPILGIISVASVVLMTSAWLIRSQRMYEIGLVLAVGAWAFRGFGLLLDGGGLGFMFPISMMVMAAGAFLLERADERAGMG